MGNTNHVKLKGEGGSIRATCPECGNEFVEREPVGYVFTDSGGWDWSTLAGNALSALIIVTLISCLLAFNVWIFSLFI